MTAPPDASIELENRLPELHRLADFIAGFGKDQGLPPDFAFALNLALDEIVTNVICYGYGDGGVHPIRVQLSRERDAVVAVIEDDARRFNPLEKATPALDQPIEDRPIGGLGMHLVRSCVDEVAYSRNNGKNRLTLKKKIGA